MLSTLSRLFQPSTSSLPLDRPRDREADPLAGAEAGRSSTDAAGSRRQSQSADQHDRVSLDAHSDSTPLLTYTQSSHFSSSIHTSAAHLDAAYPPPAPPHVFWKPQRPGLQLGGQESPTKSVSGRSMVLTTPTTPGWGAQPMNRSASSPSLLLSGPGAQAQRPSSLGRSSLSHSNTNSVRLAADSTYASESSDAESEPSGSEAVRNGHALPKQLSPIHEQQVPFPPHRKLSLDSVPRTPDSTRTFDRLSECSHPVRSDAFE